MEIKDTLCVDCICLPVCISKRVKNLLYDCALLRDNIKSTARYTDDDMASFTIITFIDLRNLTIYRKQDRVYVYTESLLWEVVMDVNSTDDEVYSHNLLKK